MKLEFGIKIASLLMLLVALVGCSDSTTDDPGAGSNWDEMKWDQGKWE